MGEHLGGHPGGFVGSDQSVGGAFGESRDGQVGGGLAEGQVVDLAGDEVLGDSGPEPELAEEALGEAVDGEDLSLVELGDRLVQPLAGDG